MKLSKWIPRILCKRSDGGEKSGVTGYFLIEWKPLFSIVLLHFTKGSRENYHDHAFNAITWFIKGAVFECKYTPDIISVKQYKASWRPKFTPRNNMHKIFAYTDTWALSFRGPWRDVWQEYSPSEDRFIKLTHGRKEIWS